MPERPERLAPPEGTPTVGPRVSKKTTVLVIGSVLAIGALIYLMRKKKQREEPTLGTEPGALTSQAFIPVTGENVAGIGAGGGGLSYGGQPPQESNTALLEYIKSNKEDTLKHEELERNFFAELINKLGTGGGAPGSQSTPAPSPSPTPAPPYAPPSPPTPAPPYAPPQPPAPSPIPTAKCPSSFPLYNPADGPPGPNSCYKYSRDRCPGPRPFKHVYENGRVVCSPT
jgi:hypothetical protein